MEYFHSIWIPYGMWGEGKVLLKSRPIPPNVPNSERNHLTALLLSIYMSPPQENSPLHTPPSHPAPSAYQIPYLLAQKTLLVILTSPGSTANTLIYTVFWLVGFVPYTLIMYGRPSPSMKTWG